MTFIFTFQPYLSGGEKVVVAVASEGETMEAVVSHLAGRAPYFIIVDSEGKLSEVIENPYKDNQGGAGVSAANFLAEKNVTIVIAGNFGGKMTSALEAHEIDYFEFEGIVEDAIRMILEKIGQT